MGDFLLYNKFRYAFQLADNRYAENKAVTFIVTTPSIVLPRVLVQWKNFAQFYR